MRLLNSATLAFEEFPGATPEYAILSHRWLDGEVSLKDMQDGKATAKAGYTKIKQCCEQASKDGLNYAWVDTCCIDKSSSAELNEAINSMYRWYQEAKVCYAYLSDVSTSDLASDDTSFRASAWFTRGWTLQELTAPAIVEFYNASWQKIGTKEDLKGILCDITNIDITMLEGGDPDDFSVAKRMSWASMRTTTRPEDRAYSLLGLFGVNMPMLYGEGDRAFVRLQEEIMKHSDDQSIFAWKRDGTSKWRAGLLAKSPSEFKECSNVVRATVPWSRSPYSVSNKGLSIEWPMVQWAMETYLVALDCQFENEPNSRVGIYLQLLEEESQFSRVPLDGKDSRIFPSKYVDRVIYKTLYVRQKDRPAQAADRLYGFWIRTLPTPISTEDVEGNGRQASRVNALLPWSDEDRILRMPTGSRGTAGSIWYNRGENKSTPLKLGFDLDFNPVCQWGGRISSPVKPPLYPGTREAELHPSWMDAPSTTEWMHRGNRLKQYNGIAGVRTRILVTDQIVNGTRMWVVDIVDMDDRPYHSTAICDGCNNVSCHNFSSPSLLEMESPYSCLAYFRRPVQVQGLC